MSFEPILSVVVPAFNEEEILSASLDEISKQLERASFTFEIVVVNDGSNDGTSKALDAAAARDFRIVPVHFSRNFGKEAALFAGIEAARGKAVLFIDADLQHPPELIAAMVEKWRDGYDVVEAVKEDRGKESPAYRVFAKLFYVLMGEVAGRGLKGASDFKLLDRQVVEALKSCQERNRFFRGLVAWVGFRVTSLSFRVAERAGGATKWSIGGLVRYSLRNVIAFSTVPLKLVALLGILTCGAGAILGVYTLVFYFSGRAVSGFTTVILLVLGLCGLILLSLGIIAMYLSQIYEEQKARPVFIVRKERPLKERRYDSTVLKQ